MRAAVSGALIGVVFGMTLSWSGMADPDVIRGALLFEDAYLFLMFAAAMAVAVAGNRLLRLRPRRALVTRAPLSWPQERPQRRHIVGSLLFGSGWGIAAACPGPILAQLGQGIPWAVFTMAGVVAGVALFLRRGATETEPACEPGRAATGAGMDALSRPATAAR